MNYIPHDDKQRKGLPLWQQVVRYFPKALREITKVSVVNNVRYNPEREPTDINWARGKSPDQLGSAFRHMMEREVDGKVFEEVKPEIAEKTGIDRTYVLAAAAWRVLAALELEIEGCEAHAEQAEAEREHNAYFDAMVDAVSQKPYKPYFVHPVTGETNGSPFKFTVFPPGGLQP